MNKNIHILFMCIVMVISTHELHAKANHEDTQIKVGISLPEQRSVRWTKIYMEFLSYTHDNILDIKIQFSDRDAVLQAYQIKKMMNSGIDVLIVSASSTPEIQNALRLAHAQGVLVVVFDSIIYDTDAIDYLVMFSDTDTPDFMLQKRWLVHLDLLRKVIEGERNHVLYFDVRYLIHEILSFVTQRTISTRQFKNLRLVNNGAKEIPTFLLLPQVITKDNYVQKLIDTHIISEEDIAIQ